MGHATGALSTGQRSQRVTREARVRGRTFTAVALAFCAIASAGTAGAQSMWDDPAFLLYRQAIEAMDRKAFAEADELTAKAIAQYAAHPLAYYLRGQAAAAQSRWEEAAAAFGKAAALYPGSFAAQRDLGVSLERLDKFPAAVQAYTAALAIRESDDLRARMAFALVEAGEEPRALTELQTLAARDTTLPEVWSMLGRITYGNGDWPAAEKAYTRAAALRDDGRTWFNLGVVRARLNNMQGALQAFERAAQHTDVKKQADTEAARIREAMTRDGGTSRQIRTPGQYSVPAGTSPR